MGHRRVPAMDHSSQQHQHHQQIRVVKPPNRLQHGNNHTGFDSNFDRQHIRSRSFAPSSININNAYYSHNHHHQQQQQPQPEPMPAVKILAKSSKPLQADASSGTSGTTTTTSQVNATATTKTPTIVANRQSVSGIVTRPSDGSTLNRSTANCTAPSKPSISNSVSILEKQLARMNIVPSVDQRERELQYNCTKLLDGEFNLQDTNTLERCLLADNMLNTSQSMPANSSGQSFCIVGAVGLDGVGKSTLLNTIANKKVFKTHQSFAEERRNSTKASSTATAAAAAAANITSKNSHISGLDNPLTHVTSGIDLHITTERLFLLDTQPLLSASILDEFLRNTNNSQPMYGQYNHHHHHMANGNGGFSLSSVVGFDITEPENFAYIYSMQLLTFMFSICDHLVLVLDSYSLDVYLLKLVASALMMVGDAVPKANLIIYLKPQRQLPGTSMWPLSKPNTSGTATASASTAALKTSNKNKGGEASQSFCDSLAGNSPSPHRSASHNRMYQLLKNTIVAMLGPNVNIDFITDEQRLMATVLKPPSRNLLLTDAQSRPIHYTTERAWFHSVQRFWDNSIRKSSLFADYARYLP